ncbi:MAG: YgiT-type zinc finger protein [Actinomycetota bacterium]|nr:YgiT-type zinc finger protein [Actinomycetota bacterium]
MQFLPREERETYPETCYLCGGMVTKQVITISLPEADGRIRLIHGVPAGVCGQCHEYYLTVETSRHIDRLLAQPPSAQETEPVWEFATAV